MRGTKTEVRDGVWKLRVYVGRNPNGSPRNSQDLWMRI